MSIQAGKILDVLILLMLANGAPLLAKQLLGDRRSHPLEGHLRFADGRRLFDGTRCDPRGACDGSRRRLLGYRYWACRYDWSEARLGGGIFFAASSSGGSAWRGAAWRCGWFRSRNRYRPALLNASFAQRFPRPWLLRSAGQSNVHYIARRGACSSNSCNCCFQNLATPVVPWPRVSSLAGIR